MSEELKNVQDMFNDYESQKNNPNGTKKKFENILAKYFVPRNSKEYFRILPPNNGEKIVEKAFFHQIQVNSPTGKKWKKVYCLSKNGDTEPKLDSNGNQVLDQNGKPVMVTPRCPLCEKQKELLDKQDKSLFGVPKDTMTPEQKVIFEKNKEIFKEASKYEGKPFYIVAGIDRLAEKDGKKFWRFKHHYKNSGVLDKLMPVLSDFVEYKKVDFSNPVNGADLSITVVDSSMPNGRNYKDVSAITIREQAPLHNDQQIAKQWVEDTTSWREVFKPASAPNITPQEFMEMIISETSPYWDDSNPQDKHWVFPGRPDLEQKARERQSTTSNDDTQKQTQDINNLNDKIGNLTQNDAGTYQDNHVDMTANTTQQSNTQPQQNQVQQQPSVTQQTTNQNDDYVQDFDEDDLPF